MGLKKTNTYDKLKDEVKNIIENYKDDFTQEYEKLKLRNVSVDSNPKTHTQTKKHKKGIKDVRFIEKVNNTDTTTDKYRKNRNN